MSCIHFKFSNTFENDKIKFDGLQISLADLKESIVKQKNLKSNMYTLKIIDSQSKKGGCFKCELSIVTDQYEKNCPVLALTLAL